MTELQQEIDNLLSDINETVSGFKLCVERDSDIGDLSPTYTISASKKRKRIYCFIEGLSIRCVLAWLKGYQASISPKITL